jgi:hypothetical protein
MELKLDQPSGAKGVEPEGGGLKGCAHKGIILPLNAKREGREETSRKLLEGCLIFLKEKMHTH